MRGEMFGRDVMLTLPGRTVDHGDLIFFGPSSQTTAESPRHAHQMIVVQVVIGTVQRTPPGAQASARLPQREVCVQDHTIDAIITAFEKIAERVLSWSGMLTERTRHLSTTATAHCRLPRRGHFFGAESPKKRSCLCIGKRGFCSRYMLDQAALRPTG